MIGINLMNGLIKKKHAQTVTYFRSFLAIKGLVICWKIYTEQMLNIKNHDLVNINKSGLSDLTTKIQTMAEEEKEIKKPNEMIEILEESLEFNKQIQQGKRIKLLTPDQMLSRLPVYLSQLQAAK